MNYNNIRRVILYIIIIIIFATLFSTSRHLNFLHWHLFCVLQYNTQVKIETFGISHKCFSEVSCNVYLWDISIETFMRYLDWNIMWDISFIMKIITKKIILSWYLINVKIRLLWEVSNETFMRHHQWNLYEISGSK